MAILPYHMRQLLILSVIVGTVTGGIAPTTVFGSTSADSIGSHSVIEINSCTTISESGHYVLTANITNSTEESCIRIEANDVIFDANGYTISGVQNQSLLEPFTTATDTDPITPRWANHGVVAGTTTQVSNVTVADLTVTNWTYGVAFLNASSGIVRKVSAEWNGNGINLFRATESIVSGSSVANNSAGIVLQRTQDSAVRKSVAENNSEEVVFTGWTPENNAAGIVIQDARNTTVTESTAANNSVGITLYRATNSTITDNTIYQNTNDGIKLLESTGATVSGNDVRNTTTYDGIYLRNSSENTIRDNTVMFNNLTGIAITDESNANTIAANQVVQNGLNGLLVYLNSTNNTLEDNYLRENAHSGVAFVDGANRNVLTGSVIENTTGTDEFSTQAGYSAGVVINESNNNRVQDTIARNNGAWAFYSVEDASENSVQNFTIAKTARQNATTLPGENVTLVDLAVTVSFVSRDVALDVNISKSLAESGLIEPDWELTRIGPDLRATRTSEDGRIQNLIITWEMRPAPTRNTMVPANTHSG